MCLVEEEEEDDNGKDEEQEERRERGIREETVSQVETKEGEEALRFFRARDFETCLSALKSREIKEPRPKPGGHDRGERERRRGGRDGCRRDEKPKEVHGIYEGWPDRDQNRRALAKSSSPFVHAPRFPLVRIYVCTFFVFSFFFFFFFFFIFLLVVIILIVIIVVAK